MFSLSYTITIHCIALKVKKAYNVDMERKSSMAKYSRIIMGLPVPHAPIAVSWQIVADLRKAGLFTDEVNRFDTLQVELIRNDPPYLCVIHSELVAPEGSNNSKIAFIINLAKKQKSCQFRILNFSNGIESTAGFPENLLIWEYTTSDDIKDLIISQMQVWH